MSNLSLTNLTQGWRYLLNHMDLLKCHIKLLRNCLLRNVLYTMNIQKVFIGTWCKNWQQKQGYYKIQYIHRSNQHTMITLQFLVTSQPTSNRNLPAATIFLAACYMIQMVVKTFLPPENPTLAYHFYVTPLVYTVPSVISTKRMYLFSITTQTVTAVFPCYVTYATLA